MARFRLRDLFKRKQDDGPPTVADIPMLPKAFGEDDPEIVRGVLCIPDISGYTGLLSAVEIVHAHEIITRLMRTIIGDGWVALRVSKLVGDAVLMYREKRPGESDEEIQRQTLTSIRSIYEAFEAERDATVDDRHICICASCQNVAKMELKFVVHWGEFMAYDIERFKELMGKEVIVAFRLLKNTVGRERYVLMTEDFLSLGSTLDAGLDGSIEETYEHIGPVRAGWIDPKGLPASSFD